MKEDTHSKWGYYAQGEEVWNREGFNGASGGLTSIVAECVRLETKSQIYSGLLEWISQEQSHVLVASVDMNARTSFARRDVENSRIRSEYLGRRAQSDVQAVSIF